MSTDLAPLIARVEAATGGDRRLDLAIAEALKQPFRYTDCPGGPVEINCARYTSSLDYALALVERVLPGWNASAILLRNDPCEGHVWEPGHVGSIQGKAETPALALLLALLRALQAQPGRHNARDGSSQQISLNPTSEAKTR